MTTSSLVGPVRRIVIVRIGKIGDLIVSNFTFRKIREAFPHARIMLVTLPRNRELLMYNRTFDRIRYFHHGADLVPLLLRITIFRPDVLLDFNDHPSTTSALISQCCPSRDKVGFAFPGKRLTHPVECPSRERTHITERLRLIPEAIGLTFTSDEVRPSMDLGESEAEDVRRVMQSTRNKGWRCVAVNLSAGDPSRYWPVDRWRLLLENALSRTHATGFLLLTAPGEEHFAEEIRTGLPQPRFIGPVGRSFHHFAASIAQADLLISADTSAVHIASAFKVPVLGLYPSAEWNFRSWQPIGTRFEIVRPLVGAVGDIDPHEVIRAYDLLTRIW